MILAIAIGMGLTVLTISVHAAGTAFLIRRLRRQPGVQPKPQTLGRIIWRLSGTASILLTLHLIEVILWAVTYQLLPDAASPGSMEDAVYFSAVTYMTLGYGDIVLSGPWRMLSAMQASIGVLICGWSTAILIALVQAIYGTGPAQRGRELIERDEE